VAKLSVTKRVERAARVLSKGLFAGFDLFMGPWPGPRVLIYHQICEAPSREMDIAPEGFAQQLDWLTPRYQVVSLDEALDKADQVDADRNVVLTFDDGYSGLFEHAFPLLLERGLPFTLYLTSQMVDDQSEDGSLNWDHVNRMQESGLVTLGGHTHTHPDLRQLTSGQIEEEVVTSNVLIERNTGVRPRHFAYTKGYWSSAAEPVVKHHYETAVLGAGPPITGKTDRHRISRVPIQLSDGFFYFKRKISRGMRLEEWARSRLKGYANPH
jgi:peptidoglycan/xylan/chitin deacetylase (PgdA/CDA1 family)